MGKWGSIVRVGVATIAWAAVHSLFASRKVKQMARQRWGERRCNQLYRSFYNTQSLATVTALCVYTRRVPDYELYHVKGRGAQMMRAGQILTLLYAAWTVYVIGVGRLSGAAQLLAGAQGTELLPESEGQGPSPHPDGSLEVSGPFQFSRHALNFVPIPLLWLFPRMGVKFATFNALSTVYFVMGSLHEEARQRAFYGQAYEDYRSSGVAFFLPRPPRRLPPAPPEAEEA